MIIKPYYRMKEILTKTGDSWDKLAPTEENAIAFAEKYLNKEPAREISSNQKSLEYYLAHYGDSINNNYRKGYPLDNYEKKIPSMIRTYSTKKDIVVYRGVGKPIFELMKKNAKSYSKTDLFERGFLFTSLVKHCEINHKIKLRIFVPAGTHAVYQGNINFEQSYYEVDIQHNAQLKIISIDKEYINCQLLCTA